MQGRWSPAPGSCRNGDTYEGEWRDGKEDGRGTYHFANGDKCEGEWEDNRLQDMGNGWKDGRLMKCYTDGAAIKFTD